MGYSRRGGGCQPLGELTLTWNCASLARRKEKETSGTGGVFRTGVRTPFLMIASYMFLWVWGRAIFIQLLQSITQIEVGPEDESERGRLSPAVSPRLPHLLRRGAVY